MISVDALAEAASILLEEQSANSSPILVADESVVKTEAVESSNRKKGRPRKQSVDSDNKQNLRVSTRKRVKLSIDNPWNIIRIPGKSSKKTELPNLPECPVCGAQIWGDDEAVNEHIDKCVKPADEKGNEEGAEWSMCGVDRVRAVDLLEPNALGSVVVKEEASGDSINIDEVEDEKYGVPQYTVAKLNRIAKRASRSAPPSRPSSTVASFSTRPLVFRKPPRTLDLLRIMQHRIRQQESHLAAMPRCNICLSSPHQNPVVSTLCWHVYCEACWAQAFQHKRLCPQCSIITQPSNLRRIYL